MPFNIENFKSQGLRQGGARPTQFEVDITMLAGVGAQVAPRVKFLVTAASLPSFIVEPVVVPYFGRQIKFSGDRVFQDWQVTCMNDEDFALRNAFETWSNKMNTLISNQLDPDMWSDKYKTVANVTQFGKSGQKIRKYDFYGIFPTQVDNIGLQWDAINQIESFGINFSYDYFVLDVDVIAPEMGDNPYMPVINSTTGN